MAHALRLDGLSIHLAFFGSRTMSLHRLLILALMFIAMASAPRFSAARNDDVDQACRLLVKEAVANHLSKEETPAGRYTCVADGKREGKIVFGLHYRAQRASGSVGSNLVGWYAVDTATGRTFEWDMATQSIGKMLEH